jgi:hypothetical protein
VVFTHVVSKQTLMGLLILVCCAGLVLHAGAATTEVTVTRYSPDGTLLSEYGPYTIGWMEANLPVMGDGSTHYYLQGPSFDEANLWDPSESVNTESRDLGAVKGTDVADLCDLAGGMQEGDVLRVIAEDGFFKNFPRSSVYNPPSRQGPMVLAWYNAEEPLSADPQGVGYPPDYYTGMRLAFFADTSVNPDGKHIFGNSDMQAVLPDEYRHYFSGKWPSSSGLSVKYVNELRIIEGENTAPATPVPEETTTSAPVLPAAGALIFAGWYVMRQRRSE